MARAHVVISGNFQFILIKGSNMDKGHVFITGALNLSQVRAQI